MAVKEKAGPLTDESEVPPAQKREKQRELDGFEALEDPELRAAAEAYVDAKAERLEAKVEEDEAQLELIRVMREKGLRFAAIDKYIIEVVEKEDAVRVKLNGKPKTEKKREALP